MDPGKGQNCMKDRLACAVHLFSVLKNQACCRKQGRIEIRGSDESLFIDLLWFKVQRFTPALAQLDTHS